MKLKLLALTFLIISLAVTPVYATPSYIIHTSGPVWIPHHNPYAEGPTVHFGGGVYVWTDWNDLRITSFFVDAGSYAWFNYTVDYIYSGANQRIYCSYHTVSELYVNDVLYMEDTPSSFCYWYENYGVVYVSLGGVSKPANVSIAYAIPVAPGEETVAISISTYSYNVTTFMEDVILAGYVKITDEISGNETTSPCPTYFSLIKGRTYTLTFLGDDDWDFYAYGSPLFLPMVFENSIRDEFEADTHFNLFFVPVVPGSELLPVPIIFIFGMVGLACMFVGPIYGINKIKQKEYRQGFVWATIITALGFALFIAWLFGGVF